VAGTIAGPLTFTINADWTRWNRDFTAALGGNGRHAVSSITLDVAPAGLTFNPNPNRFSVGDSSGVTMADITQSFSADVTQFTMTFAPGSFSGHDWFDFGLSVFAPIQGSTQEDPDRFRGMNVTVTLDNGASSTSPVIALPKQAINNFTGYGLVNADRATRRHDD
jgi:hypothetical protein